MAHRTIPDQVCKTCGGSFRPRARDTHYCTRECYLNRPTDITGARIWSRVLETDKGCWEWQGARDSKGYGRVSYLGRPQTVSRVAWELVNGPIPDGMEVCHTCDNPPCINPAHLWIGTRSDNQRDSVNKKRNRAATHPERYQRGKDSFSAKYPERLARGEKHGNARLKTQDVHEIRQRYANGESVSSLARAYNINWSTVDRVVKRKWWKHV